jgi:hypothetical protein
MNNWDNSTPRQQYGFNTPEAQPIRLVAEELLEEVTNAGYSFIWNDRGSRVRGDLSAWRNKNSKYIEQINVSTLVPYYDYPRNVKSYTIKSSAFEVTDEMLPLNFKDDLVDEKKYGIGFHGSPHRSAK